MYRVYSPDSVLRPYVECCWTLHASGAQVQEVSERIFVDGRADLIFNLGSPYSRQRQGQEGADELVGQPNLDGPREHPVLIVQAGEIHLAGVRFKPGGLSLFLTIPLHELRNQVVDASCIFGEPAARLGSQLYDRIEDPPAQARLLNQFLLDRFQYHSQNETATLAAFQIANHIHRAAGRISIRQLSREAGYSPRHLDRVYQRHFGMSPKFHARVARFQQALRMLLSAGEGNLLDIVAACGYYDQPHLNREFNLFAGQSPLQYRAQLAGKAFATPPPNLVRFLQEA